MIAFRVILGALAVAIVSGCASWPPPGGGGMAEEYYSWLESASTSAEHVRLACTRKRLDATARLGAVEYLPASLHIAKTQWARAARAVAAGMMHDASADLDQLDRMLESMTGLLSQHLKPGKHDITSVAGTSIGNCQG